MLLKVKLAANLTRVAVKEKVNVCVCVCVCVDNKLVAAAQHK